MGAIVPRRSFCGSGAFLQNRPRSSLDYKIGWFRKWVVLQAGKWGQMRHRGTTHDILSRPRVPKCHIRIRTSLQMRHFPACPKVSHSKSDKSADAGDDALTKDLEREVSDHSYHFRGLWKGGFQGPFSVVSRPKFPTNAYFFKKKSKKNQKNILKNSIF